MLKRSFGHVACCVALVIISTVSTSQAQPLADRVPEDAIVYVGWCGSTALPPGYNESHLKALLDESNIPELFTQFVPALVQKIGREEPDAQQPLKAFMTLARPMWKYPTALYFSGVDMEREEPMPKIALVCKAGAEAQAVHDMLDALLADAGDDVPLKAFRSGDLVGVYIGYADEKAALAGEGGTARPLGAAAGFKNALAQVQSDSVVIFYVDLERGMAQVNAAVEKSNEPQAQELWPKVRDASGLTGFKRVIFTDGFDGKEWATRGFMEAPAPRTGLLELMDSKPLSDELFKAVPQGATMVFAGKFDPGAFVTKVREIVGAVDPEAQKMFDRGLGGAQMMLGKNLQTDILDPLGDEWAVYLAPEVGGNGATGVVIVNKLDDAAKAQQGLVALSLFANNMIAGQMRDEEFTVSFKNTKIDGMTVWYFAVPLFAPSWGIKDGNLYLGLFPQSVGAAARFAGSGQKSFLENEKYKALRARLGVQQPRGVQFMDLPQLAGPGYQILLVYTRLGFGFADMWGVQAPEPVLPAFDRVLAHLSPAGSMSWVDDAGWHMKGIAPFPGSGLLAGEQGAIAAGGAAMMAGVLLPSMNRARETANRVKCSSNLRMHGQAIMIYSNENRGKYPDDYATLVKYMRDMDVAPDALTCPSHGAHTPKPLAAMTPDELANWATASSPYVYLGGGKRNDAPADVVIMYERIGSHDNDGVNFLYGDGHVEFHQTAGAEQILAQQGVEPEYVGRR